MEILVTSVIFIIVSGAIVMVTFIRSGRRIRNAKKETAEYKKRLEDFESILTISMQGFTVGNELLEQASRISGSSGATIITYLSSSIFRKGKPTICDMANAALAGGVAIGATCNVVSAPVAFGIGALAGLLCVVGCVFIQPALQSLLNSVDTCVVHNLHGMPGLLGGIIAIFVVPGIVTAHIVGIVVTVVLAAATGVAAGYPIIGFPALFKCACVQLLESAVGGISEKRNTAGNCL